MGEQLHAMRPSASLPHGDAFLLALMGLELGPRQGVIVTCDKLAFAALAKKYRMHVAFDSGIRQAALSQ
jgi:hypothetical protein